MLIDHIRLILFFACCGIGVITFGAIFVSLFQFKKVNLSEILWTTIPLLMVVIMVIPAT